MFQSKYLRFSFLLFLSLHFEYCGTKFQQKIQPYMAQWMNRVQEEQPRKYVCICKQDWKRLSVLSCLKILNFIRRYRVSKNLLSSLISPFPIINIRNDPSENIGKSEKKIYRLNFWKQDFSNFLQQNLKIDFISHKCIQFAFVYCKDYNF